MAEWLTDLGCETIGPAHSALDGAIIGLIGSDDGAGQAAIFLRCRGAFRWRRCAQARIDFLRASEAKNADLGAEIGGRMEDVCESCHQTFWYLQGKPTSTRK